MTAVEYEQIRSERRGAVALLTLNRPEKLNAWSAQMQTELRDAIAAANDDPEVGAVVLTGAGRAYCAGADIGAWKASFATGGPAARSGGDAAGRAGDTWVQFLRRSKPIVAAVNGVAVGVGLTHILPADVRIAGESARFGAIFAKMGLVPELASRYYLIQNVGLGAAQELCMTARILDAAEARRLGLVSRVVPDDRLVDEALATGGTIAALPGTALRLIKDLFTRNAVDHDLTAVLAREGESLQQAYQSAEFREAVTAFTEKRQPDFRAAAAAR
jgi:2-(1,2-epoxy-1,2-dihydrophenyl)acetyl-CoA isomerase